MKYKLVLVEWLDASHIEGWATEEEVDRWNKENKGSVCFNVGWLLREDKDKIILCARTGADTSYGFLQKIMRKMIVKITVLKYGR